MKKVDVIELFLLDMDGTLYLDDEALDGAVLAVERIRKAGRKVCFLTNNSSKSRKKYLDKLKFLGFSADLDEIYSSGLACIEYLKENYKDKSIFLLGTNALKEEFLENGISLTEDFADAVVVGYDTELTYDRLARACVLIRKGAGYIATHPDINCPAKGGYLPDTGSFIKLIEASTGRLPDAICGKPHDIMAKAIQKKYGMPSCKIAMAGDRLTTDIRFAERNGFFPILVLTGETTSADNVDKKTTLVLNGIKDLEL